MPRPPGSKAVQITLWMPIESVERADAVVAQMARPGLSVTRTDIFRMALVRGLELVEARIAEEGRQDPTGQDQTT